MFTESDTWTYLSCSTFTLGLGLYCLFNFRAIDACIWLYFMLFMVALRSRCGHYILPCGFFLSFFIPRLISAVADWMSTIGLLRHTMWSANLECMSEMCCTRLAGNTGRKKSPSAHHRTNFSGYIFGTKACIDNRKKNLLNSNTSSTCQANMVNLGLLTGRLRSVGEFCASLQISTGFASRQRYCTSLYTLNHKNATFFDYNFG